ncbi:hypothetical protein EHO59_01960 [Leptospira semungkisensis]|uniref:DUF1640 domain-containing protein n=1 Tax=Leptospira semungkisensis TaxID=2484985 RepID=A0A4R9G7C9_9LEPT|nr:hypothetical protein [Leptospira semungkisensis]TGK06910.1 hypothetical protein EHO59_01960 [Leptospira semungkisensis]
MRPKEIFVVPKELRDSLGEAGTEALVGLLNQTQTGGRKFMEETISERFERRLVEETGQLRLELRDEVAKLRGEMADFKLEIKQELQNEVGKLRQELTDFKLEVKEEFKRVWIAIAELKAEMHAGFAKIQEQFTEVYKELAEIHKSINNQTKWIIAGVFGAVFPIYLALIKLMYQ